MIFGKGRQIMTTFEILQLAIGSGSILGVIVLVFRTGKMVQKFEDFTSKFLIIETKLNSIDTEIKKVNDKLEGQGNRLTAIETTLRLADWFVPYHDHEREKAQH
jgi:hypothetical protein